MFEGFLKGIVPTINCEDDAVVTSGEEIEVGATLVLEPSKYFHWLYPRQHNNDIIPALVVGGAFCTK